MTISRFMPILLCLALLAACAPAPTPTATPAPTDTAEPPTPTQEIATAEPQAATEAADATDAAATEADATEATGAQTGDGVAATISTSIGRLREAPSLSAASMAELAQGEAVTVLGRSADSGYALVRTAAGDEGWIALNTLTLENRFADLPVVEPES